jgi:hypothetical protein
MTQGILKNEMPCETLCIVSVPSTTLRISSEAFITCRGRTSSVLRAWKIRGVALHLVRGEALPKVRLAESFDIKD